MALEICLKGFKCTKQETGRTTMLTDKQEQECEVFRSKNVKCSGIK